MPRHKDVDGYFLEEYGCAPLGFDRNLEQNEVDALEEIMIADGWDEEDACDEAESINMARDAMVAIREGLDGPR